MKRQWIYTALALVLLPSFSAFAARIYVDITATGAETGASWNNAFRTIQAGVDAANSGDEIWVAQGTYNEARSDPSGAVILKEGLTLYGGFRGNEQNLQQRNWQTRITTIDGSSARSGAAAYHTLIGAGGVVLDGFTITGGNANGGTAGDRTGGGLLCEATTSTLWIRNCRFTANSATESGGAVGGINAATIAVENCQFSNNTAANGGAVGGTQTPFTFVSSTFNSNTATSGGGAAHVSGASAAVFSACWFINNQAANGGAIRSGAPATVENCIFLRNTATFNGGALEVFAAAVTVVNSTVFDNSAGSAGGALYDSSGGATVRNAIFWGNTPTQIGGAPTSVTFSCIEGGYGANTGQDPMFANTSTDDYRLKYGSPCIDTGTSVGAPATDMRSINRPQGGGFDMGAYEMHPGEWPVANFYAIPVSGPEPLIVQFTDLSAAGTDPIIEWYWDFGDQYYSTQQHPTHLYATPGVYNVSLTVSSILGDVNMTRNAYITVEQGSDQLVADFTATPTRESVPFVAQFNDLSTSGTATIFEWYWDFGDGQHSYAQNPSHLYENEGRYTVSLTLITTQGNVSETKINYIDVVGELPVSGFGGTIVFAMTLAVAGATFLLRIRKRTET